MSVPEMIHNAVILLFGIFVSSAFLGIRINKKSLFSLLFVFVILGNISLIFASLFGNNVTEMFYPFIVHLPLILIFTFYFRANWAVSTLSILNAYLCCQVSNWIGILLFFITNKLWLYFLIRIISNIVLGILLCILVPKASQRITQKPTRAVLILSIMPITYYIFDYTTSVYTNLLYSGLEIVVEFLGFVLCIAYLLFIFLYFKQYEEKKEAERLSQFIQLKRSYTEKEIETAKKTKATISIIRHDMRHFLSNILIYIENGETEKAQNYIKEIIATSEHTTPVSFGKNEIVNMILTSFVKKIEENSIDFKCSVSIPETLPFSDVDVTSILSNAMENAINAARSAEMEKRIIELDMRMNCDKLLISVKNTFKDKPIFKDGMPKTLDPEHGIGTESIKYVVEKLGGIYQFSASDDFFKLRIIL